MANREAVALPGEHVQITTDTWTEPFWEAAKAHRLTACQCGECGRFRMPPTPFCPYCRSQAVTWPTLPGTGTVYSYTICLRSPFPGVPDFTFVPVVVDLDEAPGARLVTNLVGIDVDTIRVGMKVTVDWNPIQDGWVVPIFKPAEN